MSEKGLPVPTGFLDHREFLAAWFAAKKELLPSCSHRWFAMRAGTSSSLLHHVIKGQRDLSETATEGFIGAMKLRAGEAAFFRLLVAFGQAPNADRKQEVWEKIRTTRRFREARALDRSAYDYLANWYVPAIRELATTPFFDPDPKWVAGALIPPITVSQATAAMDVLRTLGLWVEVDGEWRVAEASVATPAGVKGLAVRQYHRGMLGLAADSIERFEGSERHLLGVTVSVPRDMMPVLKAETTALVQRIMDLCDSAQGPREQVVQVALQLFPVSRNVGEEES